jgi:flagellar M-ring protein FliF
MLGASALVAVMAAAWLYSRAPDYGVLYTNLSDRDGGAIITSLQQMNIPYQFAAGGGALLVPASKVPEARLKLAQQGLPKGGTVGFELMDNQKFGTSQFAEQVNYQRALEGELARSINAIGSVESSRIHLALPKPTLFVRDQKKPSASVVLSLHRGRSIDDAQVSAIVHLVSSSVPELSPQAVTVVDQAGHLLSGPTASGQRGLDGSQLKYVQEIEQNTIRRIEAILQPILGPGNAQAQVTADIDFSTVEKTDETYRPNQDGTAAVRSQQSSESGQLGSAAVGGVPGALSNQPPLNATAPLITSTPRPGQKVPSPVAMNEPPPRTPVSNGRRDATTNYEVDRSIRHTQQGAGGIRRLSVAVVVNYRKAGAGGDAKPQALSAAELEQVNNLVKEAMGFSRDRGDSLSVANSPFAQATVETVAALPLWREPENVALAKSAGSYLMLALLALFAWLAVLRPLLRKHLAPPVPVQLGMDSPLGTPVVPLQAVQAPSAESRQALEAQRHQDNVAYAQQLATQDPRTVAMLLNHWMTDKS